MRRRVVRDLGTLAGVAVVIAILIGFNIYTNLGSLKAQYNAIRKDAEAVNVVQRAC